MVGGGGGMLSKGKKVEVCAKQSCRNQNIESGENKSVCEKNQSIFKQQCGSHFS